jgi:Uma2 family endonuclease
MVTNAVSVPVEEYLTTDYSPDVDYVDGEIQERNVGEDEHGTIQKFFIGYFLVREDTWRVRVIPENRVQTSRSRYRVPDVCVVAAEAPFGGITRTAPLLCVEVLSPEDRMSRMQDKVDDFIGMGVRSVWIIDPYKRRIVCADRSVTLQPAGELLTVHGTEIAVPVSEVFRELNRLQAQERARLQRLS